MTLIKLPPIEKIPEAYSAIVDQRVELHDTYAKVASSNYAKYYHVTFDSQLYTSNDAATSWQGYPGYPILAVWMKQGILPYNDRIASYFKGIDWHKVNKSFKRDYAQALQSFYDVWEKEGIPIAIIKEELQFVYEKIKELDYTIKKNTRKITDN